jgi:hypothetical protein
LAFVVAAIIAVAIFYPGLRDTYDYFAVFGRLEANRHAMGNCREVLVARAAGDHLGTHQIWIDDRLRLNQLTMSVLFWRPRRVLYGRAAGGLDDPSYRLIEFSDSRSLLPRAESDMPIALVTTPQRTRELSGIFRQLESREFPNWEGTHPLFSMCFLEAEEVKKKSTGW